MRMILVMAMTLWGLAASASEQGIKQVIGAQMDAFRAGDVEDAFSYASPRLQRFFGSSERFGTMVRTGYPEVWQPGYVRLLERREIAGNLWQKVLVEDSGGAMHLFDYQMVEHEGAWRINAVQRLPLPDVGV
ncbi:DUF4864 domain-containing protein [Shimia aestuarii]|uniref:DUF4864 domain-containing protein n=1 Tax=Shimia aestuarii TaxID=254406 RepID=UPI001FB46118|nr:DUF4864 domain-containing protein [Shimia aestuarii]